MRQARGFPRTTIRPSGWRIFAAVAVSIASQGILAPFMIWWLLRGRKTA